MSHLWTSEELVAALGGRPVGNMPAGVNGISIDTRTLQPGDAFFAIKGDRFDGHDFATAALVAGAGLMVVAESRLPSLGRLAVPMIVVPDVLKGLERVGMAARARTEAKIIAVTGSTGKTSTKEALRHALSSLGKVHAADKSFNNHWGVPLTLARMPADCDYAIFEIGMNHAGEIRPLVKLVRPDVAIITMIAAAHLGQFKSLDEIALAKAEIFEGLVPGGHALINRDDARWKILEKQAKAAGVEHIHGFGVHARATYKLVRYTAQPDGSLIAVRIGGKDVTARIGVPGRHIAQNALAVLGAAHLAGADVGRAALALGDLEAATGRGRRHRLKLRGGTATLIDESYNANPASMKAALEALGATPVEGEGRRIAVLGDMLELGSHSARLHAALREVVEQNSVDLLVLGGREMKTLADQPPAGIATEYREDRDAVAALVLDTVRAGDVVMVKSSNGIGFSRVVDAMLEKFPAAAPRSADAA